VNFGGEDGSFIGNWNVGRTGRSRLRYESMRELSIVGGESTGNMGGRG
jgi:hypothetical protein